MRNERLVALRRRLIPYGLLGPGIAWLILFFVVPMYFMGRLSLETGIFPQFQFDWNFSNYSDALSAYDTQFIRAFEYSALATVIALLIAYPLAYAIAFRGGRWKNAMLLAVIAPFFTTYLIRTLAWETILSDNGFVVNTLQTLGVISNDGRVLATAPAVIAGLTYNFLPFMILPVYASLERMDTSLIEAAKDLYASSRKAFLKVTLPLSMPGVVAGTLLTFIPATGDYINAQFLGGAQNAMIGNVIQSLYLKQTDYPAAAALSFILMAVMLVIVFIYIRFAGTEALMGEEGETR
jgi:spermidine/putrescine transport system permease protein